jgi:hypothetical protein
MVYKDTLVRLTFGDTLPILRVMYNSQVCWVTIDYLENHA